MLRVLISRRWLGALAVALGFAVAAWFLGQWQWHRYEAKAARADRINSHYEAKPQPLADVLGETPMPLSEEWTRVTATGRYAADQTLLVRNRPYEGTYGYEVLVPFTTDAGTVLVDRGWVQNARSAESLPTVPPAPTDEVTLTGWLRRSEPSLGRTPPAGQVASINLTEAGRQVDEPLLGAYVVLEVERLPDGSAPPRPTALEAPDTGLGPHQAYAFQWWLAMVGGFVLVGFGVRREYRDGLDDTDSGAVAAGAAPPRPKKVRIWDEEDG
ncbi:SURF1 family protein [Pedococcus aerophilus]|uniref:SURF1 family cytochrome oxidase biogenesis protein n=1 Tax=Pedococcus aerophilus TaxID=436356 RepID=UPI0031D3F274